MIRKARPVTSLSGTVPSSGKPLNMCSRESSEIARLSPMTHSRPRGTTTLNGWFDGLAPGNSYDVSSSGTPLTVTLSSWQHMTWSPGKPMTRLM